MENFGEKLRQFREYRKLKQSEILRRLEINNGESNIKFSKALWCLWEKDQRVLNINQLVPIANTLMVDINYFFEKDSNPENYDLTKMKIAYTPPPSHEMQNMFIETTLSKKFGTMLEETKENNCISCISVIAGIGTTTILTNFKNKYANSTIYINANDRKGIETLLKENSDYNLHLIDNSELLSSTTINDLIFNIYEVNQKGIVFVGKNIMKQFKEFYTKIRYKIPMTSISDEDIDRVIKKNIPEIKPLQIDYIKLRAKGRLSEILSYTQIIKSLCKTVDIQEPTDEIIYQALNLH